MSSQTIITKRDYRVIHTTSVSILEMEVKQYLNDGWTLAGGLNLNNGEYSQAITKEWEENIVCQE